MKLITKISLNFLSISLFIFLSGLIIFYFVLRQQVDKNINIELQKQKNSIQNQMRLAHGSHSGVTGVEQRILITPYSGISEPEQIYSDTLILDNETNRLVACRQLQFITEINGQKFLVKIFKSHAETDNLIVRIILLMTILVVALIFGLLILNRHVSQKTWKAFYDTIGKIKNYDLNSHEDFRLKESDIKEFDDLNSVLTAMTDRIKDDYYNLKEYTENASHELQTPIAVIISKMELLLQSDNLKEKELITVSDAYQACTKLSRLTNTLLLLSKIGNRQFPEIEKVDLKKIIEAQLQDLDEVIISKKIIVQCPASGYLIEMNPYLAEIMVANLIKNAIRHNKVKGTITFSISEDKLVVSNSGEAPIADPDKLFKRFYKSSESDKSVGLGLAIVQKICEVSGFTAHYSFENQMHIFTIRFKSSTL